MLLNVVKAKTEQGKDFNFNVNFQLENSLIEDKNYQFLTPVTVDGTMNYLNDELNVNAKVSFKLLVVCDNCGENFEKDIEFDLSEKFIEQYDSHNPQQALGYG